MRKVTRREIRDYIRLGMAEDVTNSNDALKQIGESYTRIAYASGTYGISAGLVQGDKTGKMYAVTARNSNLFRLF